MRHRFSRLYPTSSVRHPDIALGHSKSCQGASCNTSLAAGNNTLLADKRLTPENTTHYKETSVKGTNIDVTVDTHSDTAVYQTFIDEMVTTTMMSMEGVRYIPESNIPKSASIDRNATIKRTEGSLGKPTVKGVQSVVSKDDKGLESMTTDLREVDKPLVSHTDVEVEVVGVTKKGGHLIEVVKNRTRSQDKTKMLESGSVANSTAVHFDETSDPGTDVHYGQERLGPKERPAVMPIEAPKKSFAEISSEGEIKEGKKSDRAMSIESAVEEKALKMKSTIAVGTDDTIQERHEDMKRFTESHFSTILTNSSESKLTPKLGKDKHQEPVVLKEAAKKSETMEILIEERDGLSELDTDGSDDGIASLPSPEPDTLNRTEPVVISQSNATEVVGDVIYKYYFEGGYYNVTHHKKRSHHKIHHRRQRKRRPVTRMSTVLIGGDAVEALMPAQDAEASAFSSEYAPYPSEEDSSAPSLEAKEPETMDGDMEEPSYFSKEPASEERDEDSHVTLSTEGQLTEESPIRRWLHAHSIAADEWEARRQSLRFMPQERKMSLSYAYRLMRRDQRTYPSPSDVLDLEESSDAPQSIVAPSRTSELESEVPDVSKQRDEEGHGIALEDKVEEMFFRLDTDVLLKVRYHEAFPLEIHVQEEDESLDIESLAPASTWSIEEEDEMETTEDELDVPEHPDQSQDVKSEAEIPSHVKTGIGRDEWLGAFGEMSRFDIAPEAMASKPPGKSAGLEETATLAQSSQESVDDLVETESRAQSSQGSTGLVETEPQAQPCQESIDDLVETESPAQPSQESTRLEETATLAQPSQESVDDLVETKSPAQTSQETIGSLEEKPETEPSIAPPTKEEGSEIKQPKDAASVDQSMHDSTEGTDWTDPSSMLSEIKEPEVQQAAKHIEKVVPSVQGMAERMSEKTHAPSVEEIRKTFIPSPKVGEDGEDDGCESFTVVHLDAAFQGSMEISQTDKRKPIVEGIRNYTRVSPCGVEKYTSVFGIYSTGNQTEAGNVYDGKQHALSQTSESIGTVTAMKKEIPDSKGVAHILSEKSEGYGIHTLVGIPIKSSGTLVKDAVTPSSIRSPASHIDTSQSTASTHSSGGQAKQPVAAIPSIREDTPSPSSQKQYREGIGYEKVKPIERKEVSGDRFSKMTEDKTPHSTKSDEDVFVDAYSKESMSIPYYMRYVVYPSTSSKQRRAHSESALHRKYPSDETDHRDITEPVGTRTDLWMHEKLPPTRTIPTETKKGASTVKTDDTGSVHAEKILRGASSKTRAIQRDTFVLKVQKRGNPEAQSQDKESVAVVDVAHEQAHVKYPPKPLTIDLTTVKASTIKVVDVQNSVDKTKLQEQSSKGGTRHQDGALDMTTKKSHLTSETEDIVRSSHAIEAKQSQSHRPSMHDAGNPDVDLQKESHEGHLHHAITRNLQSQRDFAQHIVTHSALPRYGSPSDFKHRHDHCIVHRHIPCGKASSVNASWDGM